MSLLIAVSNGLLLGGAAVYCVGHNRLLWEVGVFEAATGTMMARFHLTSRWLMEEWDHGEIQTLFARQSFRHRHHPRGQPLEEFQVLDVMSPSS